MATNSVYGSMGAQSPWMDATNRAYNPNAPAGFGPSTWKTTSYVDPKYGFLEKLIGQMGNWFGGGTGAAGGSSGGAANGNFNFLDAGGNRIGGVGPTTADAGINPGAAWNPSIASRSQGDLMRVAGQRDIARYPGPGNTGLGDIQFSALPGRQGGPTSYPGTPGATEERLLGGRREILPFYPGTPGATTGGASSPSVLPAFSSGGPPTMADARALQRDSGTASALRSQNNLNLAGLQGQAGLDLSTQQALAGLMQGSQGLQNSMYGLGANEQLLSGDLGNRQLQTGLGMLGSLFGLAGGMGDQQAGGWQLGSVSGTPRMFGQHGTQAMNPWWQA